MISQVILYILAFFGVLFIIEIIAILFYVISQARSPEDVEEEVPQHFESANKLLSNRYLQEKKKEEYLDEELEHSQFVNYKANPLETKESKDSREYRKIRIITGKEDALKQIQKKLKKLRDLRITLYDADSDGFSESYIKVDNEIRELELMEKELKNDLAKLTREKIL